MKKITLLIAFVFCALNFYAQDTCDTALVITAGNHVVDAIDGSEVPMPICAQNGEGATMGEWYVYTPNQDYQVTVTTDLVQNAGKDTRVHIYNGTCASLSCVAGDDDSGIVEPEGGGNSYLSIASFAATAGTTYYIAFDNKWSAAGFDFQIIEDDPIPPSPLSFTQQSVTSTGSYRIGVVDINGDYLDDIIAISGDNIHVQLQTSDGFAELNIPTEPTDLTPTWSFTVGDYNADGFNDLMYGHWPGVAFMRSNGDMTFTLVEFTQSVASQRGNFIDLNNDGHLDAFMCHDVAPSVYFINDGNGNLTYYQSAAIGETNGSPYQLAAYYSGGNYGSIWVDYNNDRNMDMFIAKCGGSYPRYVNQMHRNTGGTPNEFIENAAEINLADSDQTWSSAWGDFDNDGDMDVFVGASSGPHVLKRNEGPENNYSFTDITATSGVSALTNTSREHVTFDFDNDGYLDIVSGGNVLRNNGDMTFTLFPGVFSGSGSYGDLNNDGFIDARRGSTVYMNDGNSNNWTKITTVGTSSNTNGIGARVEVHSASGIKIRDVRSGDGFEFMNSLNTHVGIGTDTAIDNIIIYWPSGIVDNIVNPNINEHLVIIEGQSLSVEDETLTDMVIYPNPVKDVINIQTSGDVIGKIATVFDLQGKKVINVRLDENKLDVSALSSGMFILRIESFGKITTRKFIKE
jgi:hypothetical protein